MEDLDFVRRLERFGRTCCIKDPPLITSSRRFDRRHPLNIVYGWAKLHALFWLGVSPDRLAEIYKTHAPLTEIEEVPIGPESPSCPEKPKPAGSVGSSGLRSLLGTFRDQGP